MLIPLGRGQRELIIGDRKTGKTSILMTVIKNQVSDLVIPIYAAIAKKKSDIKRLQEFFIQEGIMDKVIIVATSSYDSPSLIYQTPYAAMAIAEHFRDQGIHTLLVLDDLSTHAKFYRELSLLAKRFPGRDSYPGDIFYVHSKLLERGGNFKHPKVGDVSITCLPVIEIVEGDLTGYVSTNVMGITDGHLYLDSNIYFQGLRPAVNIPLSVTRVGRQTLNKLTREMNKTLTAFLAQYEKMQNLSHFGQELTEDVKRDLRIGELIYKFFNQPYQVTVPLMTQLIIISLLLQNLIESKEVLDKVRREMLRADDPKDPRQKIIYELSGAPDLKTFNEIIMKYKNDLLPKDTAASKPAPATPAAPPPSGSPATNAPATPQPAQAAAPTQPIQATPASPIQQTQPTAVASSQAAKATQEITKEEPNKK
jgi:F-type H+-transporting ATPase subunit alpha